MVGEDVRTAIACALSFRPSTLERLEEGERRRCIASAVEKLEPPALCALVAAGLEILRPGLEEETRSVLVERLVRGRAGEDAETEDRDQAVIVIDQAEMEERLTQAFERLAARYPPELAGAAVLFCIAAPQRTAAIDPLLRELASSWWRRPPLAEPGGESAAEGGAAGRVDPASDGVGYAEPSGRNDDSRLPRPQSFTTLDRVLIRTIVSALNRVEGSLPWEELEDLVQELIELNDSRARSWFHRGFLDRLRDGPLAPRRAGDNDDRRAWYLAGWMLGAMRRESRPEVSSLLDRLDRGDRSLLLESGSEPGLLVAKVLFRPLLEAGAYQQARMWLEAHAAEAPTEALQALLDWSERVLSESEVDDITVPLLEIARSAAERSGYAMAPWLLWDLERRRAIALRRSGRHEQARAILEQLLQEVENPADRALLLGHVALVRLGVRRLEDFAVPEREELREAFHAALAELTPAIREEVVAAEEAIALGPDAVSPLPYLCLGFSAVLRNEKGGTPELEEAVGWLRRATELMTTSSEVVWTRSGLRDRCSAYLALLELREVAPASAGGATDRLCAALDAGVELPGDLLLEALENAILTGARGAEVLAKVIFSRQPRALVGRFPPDDLGALFARSEGLRNRLREWLESGDVPLSADERFQGFRGLLAAARASCPPDEESASAALDGMERLARDTRIAPKWLDVLLGPSAPEGEALWEPFWSRTERDEALFRLALIRGRREDARALAHGLFRDAAADGDCDRAEGIVEHLRIFGYHDPELEANVQRLRERSGAGAVLQPSPVFRSVKVLFIGGNETQKRYEAEVRDAVEHLRPGTRVEFAFPGWSSNIGRFVKRIDSRFDEADVVVVMRFVRTELGHRIRRLAGERDIPWVACTGHGRDSMVRSVVRAVDMVQGR